MSLSRIAEDRWPISKFRAASSFLRPSCRRAAPAKSSKEFYVTLPGPARNERSPDALYIMSTPERFQFTTDDGLSIACVKWGGHHPVRGVVQIAHGLGEHMGRYAELAETLVHGEFVVYGNDHRGHGLTAKASGSFRDFGPGGFDQLVEDMISLRVIAKDEHRGKPYILLGHSLGSFAAQQFVLDHGHSIDGLVLSGSGTLDGVARLAQSVPAGQDPMKLMNA